MEEKRINFYSSSLEENFRKFLEKRTDINELESDYEKRLAFTGSLLLDYNGISDVSKAGSEIQIGNFIQENDFGIDLIWYDSNTNSKKHPIVFLKYFNLSEDQYTTEVESYLKKEIEYSINDSVKIFEQWNQYVQNNNKLTDLNIEKIIDQIDQITQEIDDDDLFNDNGTIKYTKIDFSLIFVFGNLDKWEPKFSEIIDEAKKHVSNYSKVTDKFYKDKKDSFRFFFEKDLENNYKKIIANRSCIEKDFLVIDNPNNILNYKIDDDSSKIIKAGIVNVSAQSIHWLWNKPNYKDNLLGLNLRYHVKKNKSDKEIDEHIYESMDSKVNDQFWFKNNGLVIICSNFEIKDNQLFLENFSIVNGGQTTANIGSNSEFKKDDFKDFFVSAKIIAVQGMNDNPDNEVTDIANAIAEATNSQKPIKKEDLLVNMQEVKEVRRLFEKCNPKVSMRTRRGETEPRKDWFPEKWQDIEYSKVIQLAAAFETIKPGTSRNSKNKLFNLKDAKEIFGDFVKNNIGTYVELIKFNYVLNEFDKKRFIKKLTKDQKFSADYQNKKSKVDSYFKYCKFFSISLIRILKIFLSSNKSITEYNQILENNSLSDSEVQKEIVKWSKFWWDKITNKNLFKDNNIDSIQDFWVNLILKKLSTYFYRIYDRDPNKNASNVAKTNKSFYREFINEIIDELEENRELYKENIITEEIDGNLNE